ncbi:MAG: hypothetical protein H7Y38_11160 [Armatimonadetes bacterium]|nr:hypothetical protein [Armatimonadota bacterium]
MATASLEQDRATATNALREVMALYDAPKWSFRILPVFDDATGNYLLMDEG